MPRRRRDRRNDIFPLLLLLGQLQKIGGLNRIPPVTLIFFIINICVHFFAAHIPLGEVCIRPISVMKYGQYERLILSAFFHADSWHLYYNMASLLWKGMKLESKIGSSRLFFFIIISTFGTSILYVLIAIILSNSFDYGSTMNGCAVGFSAVLFALKVVVNYDSNTYSSYMGITIPSKYLAWFELVLISIITPNASFLGHLCGILIGCMYVYGIFNVIFKITDSLGIDQAFNRIRHGYNYQESNGNYQQNNRRPRYGYGGMGGMGGIGGMGRRYNRYY